MDVAAFLDRPFSDGYVGPDSPQSPKQAGVPRGECGQAAGPALLSGPSRGGYAPIAFPVVNFLYGGFRAGRNGPTWRFPARADDCLRANKAMAAWGVEARVPFLDRWC
jgi:hypothetical protein